MERKERNSLKRKKKKEKIGEAAHTTFKDGTEHSFATGREHIPPTHRYPSLSSDDRKRERKNFLSNMKHALFEKTTINNPGRGSS